MKMRETSRDIDKKLYGKNKQDYQIERLHIYGDEHPSTGLKNKVVGYQFKQTLDIQDPVEKTVRREPMKPFMVNQLARAFERDQILLSPFDEVLHKQLVDYCVDHLSQGGQPVYTSKNEHFVDALGLAYLAFVLNFPLITGAIKKPEFASGVYHSEAKIGSLRVEQALREISLPAADAWKDYKGKDRDKAERKGDFQQWVKVPLKAELPGRGSGSLWGSRTGRGTGGRSIW